MALPVDRPQARSDRHERDVEERVRVHAIRQCDAQRRHVRRVATTNVKAAIDDGDRAARLRRRNDGNRGDAVIERHSRGTAGKGFQRRPIRYRPVRSRSDLPTGSSAFCTELDRLRITFHVEGRLLPGYDRQRGALQDGSEHDIAKRRGRTGGDRERSADSTIRLKAPCCPTAGSD